MSSALESACCGDQPMAMEGMSAVRVMCVRTSVWPSLNPVKISGTPTMALWIHCFRSLHPRYACSCLRDWNSGHVFSSTNRSPSWQSNSAPKRHRNGPIVTLKTPQYCPSCGSIAALGSPELRVHTSSNLYPAYIPSVTSSAPLSRTPRNTVPPTLRASTHQPSRCCHTASSSLLRLLRKLTKAYSRRSWRRRDLVATHSRSPKVPALPSAATKLPRPASSEEGMEEGGGGVKRRGRPSVLRETCRPQSSSVTRKPPSSSAVCLGASLRWEEGGRDRKSTRLNSSHS